MGAADRTEAEHLDGKPLLTGKLPQYDSLQQEQSQSNEEFREQQRRKWNPTDDRATQAEYTVTNASKRESENTAAR